MTSKKKTVTIEEKLYKLIKQHNEEHASTFSGVIGLALKQFFKIKKSPTKNDNKN